MNNVLTESTPSASTNFWTGIWRRKWNIILNSWKQCKTLTQLTEFCAFDAIIHYSQFFSCCANLCCTSAIYNWNKNRSYFCFFKLEYNKNPFIVLHFLHSCTPEENPCSHWFVEVAESTCAIPKISYCWT